MNTDDDVDRSRDASPMLSAAIGRHVRTIIRLRMKAAREMGIENSQDTELMELESETKPEEVLAEIERLQRRALRPSRLPRRPKSDAASA